MMTVSLERATAILEFEEWSAIAVISLEKDLTFFGFFVVSIEKSVDFAENKMLVRFNIRLSISSAL